jgi:hypothetical protein
MLSSLRFSYILTFGFFNHIYPFKFPVSSQTENPPSHSPVKTGKLLCVTELKVEELGKEAIKQVFRVGVGEVTQGLGGGAHTLINMWRRN